MLIFPPLYVCLFEENVEGCRNIDIIKGSLMRYL